MHSPFFVPLLLAGMLFFGSSNSLFSKFQDMQCVEKCDTANPILYEQPVYQTLQMFLGEMFCFLPVFLGWLRSKYTSKQALSLPLDGSAPSPPSPDPKVVARHLTGWKILLLWIPAACDLIGTTLMNIGLLYTPVSIYQMTRGALVLFVGAFSVLFLRRHLWFYQWFSLLIVMSGVALVGYSGSLIKDAVNHIPGVLRRHVFGSREEPEDVPEPTAVLVGVFFVLFAQIFTATQFVAEEKILGHYTVAPLVAVGWEGFFGFFSVIMLIPFLSLPSISSRSPFFDLPRGWHQTVDHPVVLWTGIATACSIAFFNYFGLSVTRYVSATARSLTDTCRTLTIWIVSLALGWERLLFPISLLQVLGFGLLVYGTFLFNHLVAVPACLPQPPPPAPHPRQDREEEEGLLASPIDETAALPADLGQSGFDVVPEGQHAVLSESVKPRTD